MTITDTSDPAASRSRQQGLKSLRGLCAALLLGFMPTAEAAEPEVIPLIAVDSYAPTALWVSIFLDYYIPEVDRRLAESGDYRIKWNKAFGGTIAKTRGVLEALQYDLADIGIVTTPYHPDKVPFYNIPYVTPFVSADIGLVARTISDIVDTYPALRTQWDDYNLVYLTTAGIIDTYQLLLAREPAPPDGIAGWKIGGVGLNMRYIEGMHGTPVNSGISDWYNNMATGLLDGIVGWSEGTISYRLYEVAPYMLDVRLGAVTSKVIVANSRTWGRLPQEVRTVLEEVADDYRDALAREADRRGRVGRDEYLRLGGTIIPVSDEERREWAFALPNLASEWADDLEARGLPGHAILHDYMEMMRANSQPIVRHWDRE